MTEIHHDRTGLSVWRQRRDWTQQDVAALLDCSIRQIARYEDGELPDLKTAFKLEALYGVPVHRLYADAVHQARAVLPDAVVAPPGNADDGPIPGRMLALDPWTQGIGFAVLDEHSLLTCGVKRMRGPLRSRLSTRGRKAVDLLILLYRPSVVVLPALERTSHPRSRYAQAFCRMLAATLGRQGVKVRRVKHSDVERAFGRRFQNKHELAVAVAERFPELQGKVPPPRKIWQRQDMRMSAFYAVVLGSSCPKRL